MFWLVTLWDRRFESCSRYECLSASVCVLCYPVQADALRRDDHSSKDPYQMSTQLNFTSTYELEQTLRCNQERVHDHDDDDYVISYEVLISCSCFTHWRLKLAFSETRTYKIQSLVACHTQELMEAIPKQKLYRCFAAETSEKSFRAEGTTTAQSEKN